MKNKIIKILALSVAVVSIPMSSLAQNSNKGLDIIIPYQDCMRLKDKNLYAGVSKLLGELNNYDYKKGYVTSNVNVRNTATINDVNIINVLDFASEVSYAPYDDKWVAIKHKNSVAYVYSEYIAEEIDFVYHDTPVNTLKSFMSYKAITAKSSDQYRLQQVAYTGNYGIRQVNGRYCIAVGSAYTTEIGTYIDVILENGIIIPCILADCKDDKDTDSSNRITHDGSLVEFITEVPNLSKTVKYTGDISVACEDWESMIVGLKIYDRKEEY